MRLFTKNELTKNLKDICKNPGTAFNNCGQALLIFFVLSYKTIGSVFMGGTCRFHPTCSDYAMVCLKQHGFLTSIKLITKRVLSCRPGGRFGFDPVPDKGCIHE